MGVFFCADRFPVSSCMHSSHDNKPAGLKAPPHTQCGSAHPAGPPPLQRQLQPSGPQLTSSCPQGHIPAPNPSYLHALPLANRSQPYALPRPPMNCPPASFSTESRWVLMLAVGQWGKACPHHLLSSFSASPNSRFHRQLSEPCLTFLSPETRGTLPYRPASHEKRPTYQRHLSEPLVPHGQPVLKQELIDPRYPEAGLPGPGLAQHPVTIKKEPQDFTFDSGTCMSAFYEKIEGILGNLRRHFGWSNVKT